MGKIIPLNKPKSSFKVDDNERIQIKSNQEDLKGKRLENSRKDEIHKLDVRDRNLKYFRNLFFTIILGLLCLIQFICYLINNIPISRETTLSIAFISCINFNPKDLFTYFKKPPP
jgi:hypothetical protein